MYIHILITKAWCCTIDAMLSILLSRWSYWIVPSISFEYEIPYVCLKITIMCKHIAKAWCQKYIGRILSFLSKSKSKVGILNQPHIVFYNIDNCIDNRLHKICIYCIMQCNHIIDYKNKSVFLVIFF